MLNDKYKLFFSGDPDDYYEVLQRYSFCDQHKSTIIRNVNEFITSCFILGDFLHNVPNLPINVFNFNCLTEFSIDNIVDYSDKSKIDYKFLHLWVIIRTSTLDGELVIHVSGCNAMRSSYTEIMIISPHNLTMFCPPFYDIKRIPNTDKYIICGKQFNPPQYKKLPLYINDIFIKEYVNMRLKNHIYKTICPEE